VASAPAPWGQGGARRDTPHLGRRRHRAATRGLAGLRPGDPAGAWGPTGPVPGSHTTPRRSGHHGWDTVWRHGQGLL